MSYQRSRRLHRANPRPRGKRLSSRAAAYNKQIRELYDQQLSDTEILTALHQQYPKANLTKAIIRGWRRFHEVPGHKFLSKIQRAHNKLIVAYHEGANDDELASIANTDKGNISRWRMLKDCPVCGQDHNFPVNSRHLVRKYSNEIHKLYEDGLNDAEIIRSFAKKGIKLSRTVIAYWRRTNGDLPPNFQLVSYDEPFEVFAPGLAKTWDYKLNHPITPDQITPGSGKKYWWVCAQGHQWQASPATRRRSGCNRCRLVGRSKFEIQLGFELKNFFHVLIDDPPGSGLAPRVKTIDGDQVVDLFIPDLDLVIEYDGYAGHVLVADMDRQYKRDVKKTHQLLIANKEVIRIRVTPLEELRDPLGNPFLNQIMVSHQDEVKKCTDLVLLQIQQIYGISIPGLADYLSSSRTLSDEAAEDYISQHAGRPKRYTRQRDPELRKQIEGLCRDRPDLSYRKIAEMFPDLAHTTVGRWCRPIRGRVKKRLLPEEKEKIRQICISRPDLTYQEIADMFDISRGVIADSICRGLRGMGYKHPDRSDLRKGGGRRKSSIKRYDPRK